MSKEEKKQPKTITMKPTTLFFIVLILPIVTLSVIFGPSAYKTMHTYSASYGDYTRLLKREDKEVYYASTANNKDDVIVKSERDLPEKPYIMMLYVQHCPLCEVTYPVVKDYNDQLHDRYEIDKVTTVYADMNSSYGKKLVEKYEITQPTGLVLEQEGEDPLVVYSGEKDHTGEVIPTTGNIELLFSRLDTAFYKNTEK